MSEGDQKMISFEVSNESNNALVGQVLSFSDVLRQPIADRLEPSLLMHITEFLQQRRHIHAGDPRPEHTFRQYRREIEKFFVWLDANQSPAINRTLMEVYAYALMGKTHVNSDKQDKENSLRAAAKKSLNALVASPLAPLVTFKPVSAAVANHYLMPLRAFLRFLHVRGHIHQNPLSQFQIQGAKKVEEITSKMFNDTQWPQLLDGIENMPEETLIQQRKKERLRFVVRFQYSLGLRISELTQHTHNDIQYDRTRRCWRLTVNGKGDHPRRLTLDDFAWEAITRYRRFLGLSEEPASEPLSLLPHLNPIQLDFNGHPTVVDRSVSESSWQITFRRFIRHKLMAFLYPGKSKEERELIYQREWNGLSPHSLRHTRITHKIDAGEVLAKVSQFAGHQRHSTTFLYYHSEN